MDLCAVIIYVLALVVCGYFLARGQIKLKKLEKKYAMEDALKRPKSLSDHYAELDKVIADEKAEVEKRLAALPTVLHDVRFTDLERVVIYLVTKLPTCAKEETRIIGYTDKVSETHQYVDRHGYKVSLIAGYRNPNIERDLSLMVIDRHRVLKPLPETFAEE